MYEYNTRSMNSHEKVLQREFCYSESQIKTLTKVIQEQFVLWLFPTLLLLVMWRVFASSLLATNQGYTLLTLFYLASAAIGSSFRYKNERKATILMEQQSEPINEEFRIGQVETCKFQIAKAFLLEEREDEGPTYILEIDNHFYTIICEQGAGYTSSHTPGNAAEIIRLPVSKRIVAVNWSGGPLSIEKTISKQSLHNKVRDYLEGDIIEIKEGF